MSPRQLGALIFAASVWGGSFLFIRVLVDAGVEPAGVSAGRCLFGTLALLPVGWAVREQFPRSAGTLAALATLGAVNMALPWTLFAVSEQHVPSSVASVGNSTTPLWTAILATAVIRSERLERRQVAGLLFGFAGVVVLGGDGLVEVGGDTFIGTLAILLATACYAASAVAIRRWLRHVPAIPLATGQVATAAALLAPVAILSGAFEGAAMGGNEWASLIVLGALGSGFATLAYMWLLGQVGAVRATVVTYLIPPIGVSLGWLVLDEPVGWNLLAGLAFVAAGVALVQRLPLPGLQGRAPNLRDAEPAPSTD